jgi:hypothetical protein
MEILYNRKEIINQLSYQIPFFKILALKFKCNSLDMGIVRVRGRHRKTAET